MVSEPRAEHPHRCTAGHRWQHTGAAAIKCEIPAYDPVTGDLPFVAATECPVCCGRQDLLVRELHPHYCNLCDGEWDHEGVCVDSLAAYCPWCFPKPDVAPVPGARRGPHFHYCSECGQNWQHEGGCSAPLRAALPECTGCRPKPSEMDDEPQPELVPPVPVRPAKSPRGRVPLAVPVGIAAAVLLALPLLYKGYTALRSPAVMGTASVRATAPPAHSTAPRAVAPSTPPAASTPTAAMTRPTTPTPSTAIPSASTPPLPIATAPAPAPPAAKAQSVAPVEPAKPKEEPRPPKTMTARDVPPSPQPRISPPKLEAGRVPAAEQPSSQRARDTQPKVDTPLAAGPAEPPSSRDLARVTPAPVSPPPVAPPAPAPAPLPARSEVAAESAKPAPDSSQAPSESVVRATSVAATLPSIPGAPPFGGLSGSSGRDTSLDGHPRRVIR